MTDVPTERPSTSRLCTAVGLAVVTAGLAAFLLDGGGGNVAGIVSRMSLVDWAFFGGVAVFLGFMTLCAVYGEIVAIMVVGAAGVLFFCGLLAFLVGSAAFGWTRFVGLSMLESSPALGTPVKGLGLLAVALGATALAYCLIPVSKPPAGDGDDQSAMPPEAEAALPEPTEADAEAEPSTKQSVRHDPHSVKRGVAVAVFFVAVVIPGWIGAAAPARWDFHANPEGELAQAELQRLLDTVPGAVRPLPPLRDREHE